MLTVVILVGASVLLILVGNLIRGVPQRRMASPQSAVAPEPAEKAPDEIDDAARQELERVLRERAR